MKKIVSLLFSIVLPINVKAQTTLTEAVDFTAVDCYGQDTIHLFEILDRGQYVLIDFYFYSCSPCFDACPHVVEAYEALGCNKHDVFFMEISPSDSDEICQWWVEKFGVEYPTISREAGGDKIDDTYGIKQYPTLVLIAPDRSIVLQDIYPVETAQDIVDALAPFGIEEHSCDEEPEEPVVTPEKPEATVIATSDTSGMSRPSRRRLMPTSTSKVPRRRSRIISIRSIVSTLWWRYLTFIPTRSFRWALASGPGIHG